jgi:hypothetical protein
MEIIRLMSHNIGKRLDKKNRQQHDALWSLPTKFFRCNGNIYIYITYTYIILTHQPPVDHSLLIHMVSRLHTTTHHCW